MTRMIRSNTPWLAVIWLCCGTTVNAAGPMLQNDFELPEAVQEFLFLYSEGVQPAAEEIQTIFVQDNDGKVTKSRKVLIKTGDGQTKTFDLKNVQPATTKVQGIVVQSGDGKVTAGGKVVIKTDGKTKTFELPSLKKRGHRVFQIEDDELLEMDVDIDLSDLKFDLVKDGAAFRFRGGTQTTVPDYMIGVRCDPVDAALRAHVEVPENALIVSEVTKGGPAAEAGIRQYDIITAVGDKPVGSLEQLVKAIQDSKGQDFAATVLRKGTETQFTIKPKKREQSEITSVIRKNLLKHLGDDIIKLDAADAVQNFRIETMRPGIVLEDSDDMTKILKRLTRLGAKGSEDIDVRVIQRSGREPGSRGARVRKIIRVEGDAVEVEEHEDGDTDSQSHADDDDDDDAHHHGGDHEKPNANYKKLQSRVDRLSKELEQLRAALKELQGSQN